MKNILIIYAHPNGKSLNAKIKDIVLEKLNKDNNVELIDLYQDQYNPCLQLNELYTAGKYDIAAQTKQYQEQITKADALVFIHPTWWYDMPAILKGFIDKVFTARFAFRFKPNGMPEGLLKGKKAILIQTYSSPRIATWIFPNAGYKNFKNSILKFCGIKNVKWLPVFSASKINEDNIESKLKHIYNIEV